MRKVCYHQIWIQNYLGFIVSNLLYILILLNILFQNFPLFFKYTCRIPSKNPYSYHYMKNQKYGWKISLKFICTVPSKKSSNPVVTEIRDKWPTVAMYCHGIPTIFFDGKYDLIQLHRQIIHQNDGISMRNWLKSSPPALFI